VRKPESSSGLSIQLVHPDEDISLEERRASLPKYRNVSGASASAGIMSGMPRPHLSAPIGMQGSMSGMGPTSSMPPGGGRGPSAPPMGYPGMMRPQMMPQGGRY